MKKKLLILCVCLLAAAVLCFPVKTQFREGGTAFYSALAYRVIVWHAISPDENDLRIMTGTDVYLFPRNFRDYEYYYERRFGARFDENATAAPTTAEAPTELQTPTETQAPTSTKAPTPAGPALPVYVPGSIKLDEGSVSEFSFRATKRYAYYHIPGLLSDLGSEGAITELFEKDKDPSKEPQEMVLVTFIKHCNISRQDFDKAVKQLVEQYATSGLDMTTEDYEIPNADIIYTFDNEIINAYYHRQ